MSWSSIFNRRGFLLGQYQQIHRYIDQAFLNSNPSSSISSPKSDFITDINSVCRGISFDYISTIGYKNMAARKQVFEWACEHKRLNPINIIHETCYISPDSKIGKGNIFFPGVIVEPGAIVGNNNIMWSNTTLCHDSILGSHNFIAASSVLGGHVKVGDLCFLGFGSIINDNLEVVDRTFLASGVLSPKVF